MQNSNNFILRPIRFEFPLPKESFLNEARKLSGAMVIESEHRITVENVYFKNRVRGSLPKVYLRSFILNQLRSALLSLPADFGFIIFDGYRGIETQAGLFESFRKKLSERLPNLSEPGLDAETRKFVAHPDEPSRFQVPPHNSGGAVDLGLTYRGTVVDLGTDFDDLTERAATDYFENDFDPASSFSQSKWEEIRTHRRILFNTLCSVGFTNWKYEWWHFDIGNCVWAQVLSLPFIYDSMSSLISIDDRNG